MAVHVNFLQRIPLLAALAPELRAALASVMQHVELPRRAVALEKGRRGQGLGFVLRGRLQAVDFTLDGREAGLYFVAEGDFFGELPVFDGQDAPEHVISVSRSEILRLPDAQAQQLLLADPVAAKGLAQRLATRMREAIALRTVLALPTPTQRLAAQLLTLAAGGSAIEHAPTHQELAIMINTTRETVSRTMQALQMQGLLARDGDRVLIHDEDRLRALVHAGA